MNENQNDITLTELETQVELDTETTDNGVTLLAYSTEATLESGIYKFTNRSSGRHIYAGDSWIKSGDIVEYCYGKALTPFVELCHMWKIRKLSNGLYVIHPMLNPDVALSVQAVDNINRVVAIEVGQCTAEVPENAQWRIIPTGNYWILHNPYTNQVIGTDASPSSNASPLSVWTYTNENCISNQNWDVTKVTSSPIGDDVLFHSDLLGWIESGNNELVLPVGASTGLNTVYYSDNTQCCSCWISSDNSVVTVSSSGMVTARKAGVATISIVANNHYLNCTITVVEGDIAIIRRPDHATVGGTLQLQAVTVSGNTAITWRSENTDYATVNTNGLVTVKKVGEFKITARATGLASKTVSLYGVIPDGVYNMQCASNNKYVEIEEKYLFESNIVYGRSSDNCAEQMWHIHYNSNGQYVIRSYANPRMVLVLNDDYPENAYVLSIPTNNIVGSSDYKWRIDSTSNGYVLRNGNTGKALIIENSNVKMVSYVENSSTQRWNLTRVTDLMDELIVYDRTNQEYFTSDTLYLCPDEFRDLRAIYRSPNDIRQTFNWTQNNSTYVIVNTAGGVTAGSNTSTPPTATNITVSSKINTSLKKSIAAYVRIPVERVELACCITVVAGHETIIAPSIWPRNAMYENLSWKCNSSYVKFRQKKNEQDKTVDTMTISQAGQYTVTVRVCDYDGTLYKAEMTVNVKAREDVKIEKDGSFFTVIFLDKENDEYAKRWESIEYDLTNPSNLSGNPLLDITEYWDTYENLHDYEKRYVYNRDNRYSEKQLAFLYLLDPLGVAYYVKHASYYFPNDGGMTMKSTNEWLKFEDRIYKELFGDAPKFFTISDDGRKVPLTNTSGYERHEYYSAAESVFGAHVLIEDITQFVEWVWDFIILLVSLKNPMLADQLDELGEQMSVDEPFIYKLGKWNCIKEVSLYDGIVYVLDKVNGAIKEKLWDEFLNIFESNELPIVNTIRKIVNLIETYDTAFDIRANYINEAMFQSICYRLDTHPSYRILVNVNGTTHPFEEVMEYDIPS